MDVRRVSGARPAAPYPGRGPSLSLDDVGTDLGEPDFQPRGPGVGGGDSPAVTPQHPPPTPTPLVQQLCLSLFICPLSDGSLPEKAVSPADSGISF